MKKPCLLAAAFFFSLLLIQSCTKKPETPGVQAAIDRSGIIAYQGAPFYMDTGTPEQPKVEWKAALDFGMAVTKREGAAPRSVLVGGQTIDVIPVELSSAENLAIASVEGPVQGWIQPLAFAGAGAEPAVVTEDRAAVLKDASSNAGVLIRLSRMSLVAATRKGASGDFLPVILSDPVAKKAYPRAYIGSRQISFSRDDVRAAVLVARAQVARTPEEKTALLEDAERSFPGSVFAADVRGLLGGGRPEAGPSTEPLVARLAARVEGARIFASPAADAAVVATLALDDVVEISARTTDSFQVGGNSAHWYEVQSPAAGWVFGTDLEGAD